MKPKPSLVPRYLAIDTETEGLDFFDKAFAVTIAWEGKNGIESRFFDMQDDRETVGQYLNSGCELVFHNAKFDLQKLELSGYEIQKQALTYHDTEAIFHLLHPNKPKRLKTLAREELGVEPVEEEELNKALRKHKIKKAEGYHRLYAVEPEVLIRYAVKDAEYTIRLFNKLYPQLLRHKDLCSLYEMEKELMWVLLEMETKGMKIDREYVTGTKELYASSVLALETEIRDITESESFNPRSNKQLREYFESVGLKRESYDKAELLALSGSSSLPRVLLELRSKEKTLKTYLEAMEKESRVDGLLHPHFRQHKAASGRMASGKPEA